MKRILFFVMVGMMLLTACGTSSDSNESNSNAPLATVPSDYAGKTNPYGIEMAFEGAGVFKANCETCHGPQGHGDGVAGQSLDPKPQNLAVLQKKVADDYLYWRISDGKPGTSMVAWEGILTEEQIWQTVSFIRSLEE